MFDWLFCKHDYKVLVDSCKSHTWVGHNTPHEYSVNIICVNCHKKKRLTANSPKELELKVEGMDRL